MSEVFFFRADLDNFASISPVDDFAWDLLNELVGHRFEGNWSPLRMEVLPTGPRGDFPYLASHVPVVSPLAWAALRPEIAETVQPLPLDVQGEEYQALNVLDVLDCLDPERAELRTLDDGSVVGVRRWALREDVVEGHDIFKARHAELQVALVSERFREWVEDAGLRGARFDPVSDAAEGTLE
jgi:hypothetical protein